MADWHPGDMRLAATCDARMGAAASSATRCSNNPPGGPARNSHPQRGVLSITASTRFEAFESQASFWHLVAAPQSSLQHGYRNTEQPQMTNQHRNDHTEHCRQPQPRKREDTVKQKSVHGDESGCYGGQDPSPRSREFSHVLLSRSRRDDKVQVGFCKWAALHDFQTGLRH